VVFGRRKRGLEEGVVKIKLDDELKGIIKYYMDSKGVNSVEKAVRDLIKMGYDYWNMKSQYGDDISDRELWDIRYKLLKLESGYLHYKLLLREALERLRALTLNLSSLLSQLDTCWSKLGEPHLSESEKFRRFLKEYSDEFVFAARKELESKEYEGIKDEDVIRDIERLLKHYKEKFGIKDGGERR